MPIRILALDIATRTGWAFGPSDAAMPEYGLNVLPATANGDMGAFFYEHRRWLIGRLRELDPEVIVFECPVMPKESQIGTLRKLYTLAGLVEEVCYGSHVGGDPAAPYRLVREEHLQSIKKFTTGRGNAKKPEMIDAVNVMFGLSLKKSQDNEADALGLWALTVHKLDEPNAARFSLGALGNGRAA